MTCRRHNRAFLVPAVVLFLAAAAAAQQMEAPVLFDSRKGPVNITSQRLVVDNQENWAEFSGQVRAVQADTEVTCETLRIWYKSGGGGEHGQEARSIDRVVAKGKVRIASPRVTATARKAVYQAESGSLLLSGHPVLQSGENRVSGSKITLTGEGRVVVESAKDAPVKARFFPESAEQAP
ncbi:MAG: hypothetical protein JRI97_03215 [Deltaproteobacteria bacterium]|nr:hypothetical protein [Deltaproteobacteria bacterium]